MTASPTASPTQTLPAPPRRKRGRTILFALIVLFSGIVIGAGGATIAIVHVARRTLQHPEQIPTRLTARLTRRLSLTPEQAEQVHTLLDARLARMQTLRAEFGPRFRAELGGLHAEVGRTLNPDQQDKWNAMYDDIIQNWLPPEVSIPASQPVTN